MATKPASEMTITVNGDFSDFMEKLNEALKVAREMDDSLARIRRTLDIPFEEVERLSERLKELADQIEEAQ